MLDGECAELPRNPLLSPTFGVVKSGQFLFLEVITYGKEWRAILMISSKSTVKYTCRGKILVPVLGRSRFVYILAGCPPCCQFKIPPQVVVQTSA